jgi:cardiolipin synthase
MHHKVILVDDDLAAVGTANFDNRSIRLNFELMLIFADKSFAATVCQMLENDFAVCRLTTADELASRPFVFRVGVSVARLLAPIL